MAEKGLFKVFGEAWALFTKTLRGKLASPSPRYQNSGNPETSSSETEPSDEIIQARVTAEYKRSNDNKELVKEADKLAHIEKLEARGKSTAPDKRYTDNPISLRPAFEDKELQAAHTAALGAAMKENDPVWKQVDINALNRGFKSIQELDFNDEHEYELEHEVAEMQAAYAAAIIQRLADKNKLDKGQAAMLLEYLKNPPHNTSGREFSLENGNIRKAAGDVSVMAEDNAKKAGGEVSQPLQRVTDLVDEFLDKNTDNLAAQRLEEVAESVKEMDMVIGNCGSGDERYQQALEPVHNLLGKE
jgi:hypothetical protein